jgi:hypothetical protein
LENVDRLYGHLEYFTYIWNILRAFGMFYDHLVYFVSILVTCTQKNLATLLPFRFPKKVSEKVFFPFKKFSTSFLEGTNSTYRIDFGVAGMAKRDRWKLMSVENFLTNLSFDTVRRPRPFFCATFLCPSPICRTSNSRNK